MSGAFFRKASFLVCALDIWVTLTLAWGFHHFQICLKNVKISFKKGKLEPKRYFGVLKEELKILTFETLGTRFLKETKIVWQFFGGFDCVGFFCFVFREHFCVRSFRTESIWCCRTESLDLHVGLINQLSLFWNNAPCSNSIASRLFSMRCSFSI